MNKFSQIVASLGEAYDAYKAAEKKFAGTKGKKATPGLKQEFLNEATKENEKEVLATKVVVVEAPNENDAIFKVLKRNPRFELVSVLAPEDGSNEYRVQIQELPEYKDFVYVDKVQKRVWTKQVVDGSPWLDEEELQEKDPDLWKKVTRMERVFVGVEELTPELVSEIEEYVYPGKPIVKLAAPRKAKPEEL